MLHSNQPLSAYHFNAVVSYLLSYHVQHA